ncbi:hypothetical protein TanjilG_22996 [Lupinus angustifolius]|uniref:SBP-type domain-containing protein n=1 Tax=Lupinus angustifolius TaxID=3871 RepID=A0A1J7GRY1_LUPAN|nr:hypothetical protein TanjilG_22996 [Lupinus angustifolius]
MEARSIERKRSIEKVRNIVEEVQDEVEEEDEGGGCGCDEKKKGASGKRGLSGGGGGGGFSLPSCQAERCGADLTDAKRYHRRHKVCEFHSKAPIVVVAGFRQRFHDLAEFDEAKRSCRRRLAGHNERRRKSNVEMCNEGCNRGKGQQEQQTNERGRIQMNMGESCGYKSFHIR